MTSRAPFSLAIKGNPAAGQTTTLYLGFALVEAFGIFSLLIALLLLFVL